MIASMSDMKIAKKCFHIHRKAGKQYKRGFFLAVKISKLLFTRKMDKYLKKLIFELFRSDVVHLRVNL